MTDKIKLPDDLTLLEGSRNITLSDLNAMMSSNTKLIILLEQISNKLEPLSEMKILCEEAITLLKTQLVDDIAKRAIEDKGLDLTDDKSKITEALKLNVTLLTEVRDLLKKVILVVVIAVTLLGGVPRVWQWLSPKVQEPAYAVYHWDESGRTYIVNRANEKLYITTIPPPSAAGNPKTIETH
jgi:hypothetical protein